MTFPAPFVPPVRPYVVEAGSQQFDTVGTTPFTCPNYNTITARLYGGGGGLSGNGGTSSWNGMTATGGQKPLGVAGGAHGTPQGSSTNGGTGEQYINPTQDYCVNTGGGGKGGGGANGGASQYLCPSAPGGNPGTVPGGGASGSAYWHDDGANHYSTGGGGGGGGGYRSTTWNLGDAGAPEPGTNYNVVVGSGGTTYGARGRVIIEWS